MSTSTDSCKQENHIVITPELTFGLKLTAVSYINTAQELFENNTSITPAILISALIKYIWTYVWHGATSG